LKTSHQTLSFEAPQRLLLMEKNSTVLKIYRLRRARYERAMGKLAANQNGMPDFLEGMSNTPVQIRDVETSFGTETPRRSKPLPVSRTMTPDTSNGLRPALVGLPVLLLCIALVVIGWMAFLR